MCIIIIVVVVNDDLLTKEKKIYFPYKCIFLLLLIISQLSVTFSQHVTQILQIEKRKENSYLVDKNF